MASGRIGSTGLGVYVASERHVFWAPKHYKFDGTKVGVIYCPPKGQTAINVLTDFIAAAIVAAGFPLISADYNNVDGTTPQWGNDLAGTRVGQVRTLAQSTYGFKSGPVLGYGGSMGSATLMRYAVDNPSNVAALAMGIPICDLAYAHDNDVQSNQAGIETAYATSTTATGNITPALGTPVTIAVGSTTGCHATGNGTAAVTGGNRIFAYTGITATSFTGCTPSDGGGPIAILTGNAITTGYANNIVGHTGIGTGGFAASLTVPSKLWHATDDPFTPAGSYTSFAASAGVNCALRSLGAVGHNTTTIDAQEIVTFLKTYA